MGLMLQSYIVTLLHYKLPTSAPESAKRNLKGLKITESRARNYGSLKLGELVLKIGSNRWVKFGGQRKMSYLCSAFGDALRVKAAAQHSSSELGSAFTLHFTCNVLERYQEKTREK